MKIEIDPAPLWHWMTARHRIYIAKEAGQPLPWSYDPVFQTTYFTNVYRLLDKTTVWYMQHIFPQTCQNVWTLLEATVIFRWFNKIETGRILRDEGLFQSWDTDVAVKVLSKVSPVVTGAYIIKTPDGMTKASGVCWCIKEYRRRTKEMRENSPEASWMKDHKPFKTMEGLWLWLQQFPYMGQFMAYEVATDMDQYCLFPDRMTWANPGPGAMRGLSRLLGEEADYLNRNSKKDHAFAIECMQFLLERIQRLWLKEFPRPEYNFPSLTMREIEHSLCEFDKYERVRCGEGRSKRQYKGI